MATAIGTIRVQERSNGGGHVVARVCGQRDGLDVCEYLSVDAWIAWEPSLWGTGRYETEVEANVAAAEAR